MVKDISLPKFLEMKTDLAWLGETRSQVLGREASFEGGLKDPRPG